MQDIGHFERSAWWGGNWNHAEAIRKDGGLLRVGGSANQATHYRMVEWIYAIESALVHHEISVDVDRQNGYKEAKNSMLRAAWANIKKANGVSSSNWGDLHTVAQRDALFIKRQFNLIEPKIVLCCATFGIVRNILFPEAVKIQGTEFSYIQQNILILDFRHPARAHRDSYKRLIDEVGRILKCGINFAPDVKAPI